MSITIKLRLAASMALLSVLLLVIGGVGLAGMTRSNDANRDTYSVKLPGATDVGDAEINLQRERAALFRAALDPKAPGIDGIISHSRDYRTEAGKLLDNYMALPHSAREQELAHDLLERRTAMNKGLDDFADALRSGDGAQAMQAALTNNDLYAAYHDSSEKLRQFQYSAAKQSFDKQEHSFDVFRAVCIAAIVIGMLTALVSYVTLRRAIAGPLGHALEHFAHMAEGDLTHRVEARSRDEMGQLLSGIGTMQTRLVTTVKAVHRGSEAIASATREVAAGNTDLSSRTEEQAASLQETAASMEQLTSTVKHNADSARQASQLASTARQVSGEGNELMEQVVTTMTEIGDSSNKIAEITSIIEGIAFQTNILALNAAVEAARAGENGRGFAVVASEVRSLAQRSSSAAREIKDLIGTSTDRVHAGTELVGRAGTTMAQITQSISRVHDIVGEIAAASNEQSRGIEQVNQAIAQMDEVTQQNAALVEQAAAAAASLQDQADHLRTAVMQFKLDGEDMALAPGVAVPRRSERALHVPASVHLSDRAVPRQPVAAIAAPAVKRADAHRAIATSGAPASTQPEMGKQASRQDWTTF
jgi:methyl-accepting chemotaxis protein-1 (serine sensor receptor)